MSIMYYFFAISPQWCHWMKTCIGIYSEWNRQSICFSSDDSTGAFQGPETGSSLASRHGTWCCGPLHCLLQSLIMLNFSSWVYSSFALWKIRSCHVPWCFVLRLNHVNHCVFDQEYSRTLTWPSTCMLRQLSFEGKSNPHISAWGTYTWSRVFGLTPKDLFAGESLIISCPWAYLVFFTALNWGTHWHSLQDVQFKLSNFLSCSPGCILFLFWHFCM